MLLKCVQRMLNISGNYIIALARSFVSVHYHICKEKQVNLSSYEKSVSSFKRGYFLLKRGIFTKKWYGSERN